MGIALAVVGSVLSLFFGTGGVNYVDTITYRVYDTDGSLKLWKAGQEDFASLACPTSGKLSFIFTGWNENMETVWVPDLISNLTAYRGGCIVVVDYFVLTTNSDYLAIVPHSGGIIAAVTAEVLVFQTAGFTPANTIFIGFSFGAQVALGVGRSLPVRIKRVDVCEPTMMGFLITPPSTLSAENVQCIHTDSTGFGTKKRDCHQDWNMGDCGNSQPAAGQPPMGNHGLCPHFYTSAFKNDFNAVGKPWNCIFPLFYWNTWPTGFKMGYQETRFSYTGEFYALTSASYPYNV